MAWRYLEPSELASDISRGCIIIADTGPALADKIPVCAVSSGAYEVNAASSAVVPIPDWFAIPRGSEALPDPSKPMRSISFAIATERILGSSLSRLRLSSKSPHLKLSEGRMIIVLEFNA